MATYQFLIELIPASWVKKHPQNAIELLFDVDGYEPSISWELLYEPELEILISNILPSKKSWNENLKIWGSEESNDIQVWIEKNIIQSIRIRFDLRSDIEELKFKIIHLSKKISCDMLAVSEKKIFSPDIELLNNYILNSNAKKFVENPGKFLDNIGNKSE